MDKLLSAFKLALSFATLTRVAPIVTRASDSVSDNILFPPSLEDDWMEAGSTAEEKVWTLLLKLAGRGALDSATSKQLERFLITGYPGKKVSLLATEIKRGIFQNKHATFCTTPLLQLVRFILIKTLRETPCKDTKEIRDFYFDPTMCRNFWKPPEKPVVYPYPVARLKVVIVGGGPTSLTAAITLAEKVGSKVEVHVYEKRCRSSDGALSFVSHPSTERRRGQVVTLQDDVTDLFSTTTRRALLQGHPERVWPNSSNIQISKVEDRLLHRAQDTEFKDIIYLHSEEMTSEGLSHCNDFHLLLGADGGGSWVRETYFRDDDEQYATGFALGIGINCPDGLPRQQDLNIFLTLVQTRYLLNASNIGGRGYLNMQLTRSEWDQMRRVDGKYCDFTHPSCLRVNGCLPQGFTDSQIFAPSLDPENPLWIAILDGLKLFGLRTQDVTDIVRIPVTVRGVKTGVKLLPVTKSESKRPRCENKTHRTHGLVSLAGDAAMQVHFWPGRGMNSGIKSAVAWADEVVHLLRQKQLIGLQPESFKAYNDFLGRLRHREIDLRSMPIVLQTARGGNLNASNATGLVENNPLYSNGSVTSNLLQKMEVIPPRVKNRGGWVFPSRDRLFLEFFEILGQLSPRTRTEMACSGPWPNMPGEEVQPPRKNDNILEGGIAMRARIQRPGPRQNCQRPTRIHGH
ncbi:hypothetical protein F5X99DRAFT_430846 [Biscogniauxia marginata]|nr:hypothetical protein F5X99DRAFT_430846 [Biscogniauxia marginata]